jgi:hypothetical protein
MNQKTIDILKVCEEYWDYEYMTAQTKENLEMLKDITLCLTRKDLKAVPYILRKTLEILTPDVCFFQNYDINKIKEVQEEIENA